MSRKCDIKKLIVNYQRRLQKLKEQQALRGLDAPPHILTEIEDIETEIKKLQTELEELEDSGVDEEPRRTVSELAEDTSPKPRVQIYLPGELSSLSADRRSAAIDAFAAVMGISSQAIEVYRVYEGSIVFDLGIPSNAVHRLRSLLQSNGEQLRLLKVEKVILEGETGEIEEWVIKEGKFDLVTSTRPTTPSGVHGKPQRGMARRYYLNDFPEPFVVNGKPDFAVIFGLDSRRWLHIDGPPKTVYSRDDLNCADITDAVNFMNLSFLLGSAGFHEVPQDCVFVENWLKSNDIAQLKKRNLILVGSGMVNSLWLFYERHHSDILTLMFDYDEEGIPKTIVDRGKKILYRSEDENGGVGFVQIATNPDSPEKAILFIAGFHGRGTSGACLALAKRLKDINIYSNIVACIAKPVRAGRLGYVFDDAQILRVITDEEVRDDKEHLGRLRAIYVENLRKLEEQIARYGGAITAPLWLRKQSEFTAKEIERIERKLEDP